MNNSNPSSATTEQKVRTEDSPEYFLDKFTELLNNFTNEMPEDHVHSTDHFNSFKVRKSWFQQIALYIELANEFGVIKLDSLPVTIQSQIQSFMDRCYMDFSQQDVHPTEKDIELGDKLLRYFIEYLESINL